MKKMTSSTIQERLELWIKDDHYKLILDQRTNVVETRVSEDGEANVSCILPAVQAYVLTLEGKACAHLKKEKCADGMLLLEYSPGHWELHIVECKRTINRSKWGKVKYQFVASIQRAMAMLASIGIYPDKIKLYTAFREDPIQAEIEANPVFDKIGIEGWRALAPEKKEKLQFIDWLETGIEIWTKEFIPHEKVELDEEGNGTLQIQCI
ncbi:hypothetical protein CBW65_01925 [Tumebacillus avium]|uniref:Uncharacterized protein n=1 Tax=Tumebacillus avium TaxID=1903704 RepID=A0A1Y0IKR2_9BACL|nr:hypothetical protein [Tumebacillus avium]ARU59954.1 hypothetical protein CBW65_01925 [Tumebacillus avium]